MYFRILLIFLLIFSTHHYDVMAKSKTRINNYVFTSEDIFTDKTKSYLNETSNSIFQKKKILVFYASYKNNCHLQKAKNVKNKDEFSVPNLRKEMLCLYDFTAKIRSKLLANLPNYADKSVVILFPPAPSEILYMINFGDAWEKRAYIHEFSRNNEFITQVKNHYLQKNMDKFAKAAADGIYNMINDIDTNFFLKNGKIAFSSGFIQNNTEPIEEIEKIASLHFIVCCIDADNASFLQSFIRFFLDYYNMRDTPEDGDCDNQNITNDEPQKLNATGVWAAFSVSLIILLGFLYLAIIAIKRRNIGRCILYSLIIIISSFCTIAIWYIATLVTFACT
jgi:hypothetical protein